VEGKQHGYGSVILEEKPKHYLWNMGRKEREIPEEEKQYIEKEKQRLLSQSGSGDQLLRKGFTDDGFFTRKKKEVESRVAQLNKQ